MLILILFPNKDKMFNQRINEKPTLARAGVNKYSHGPNSSHHLVNMAHQLRMFSIFLNSNVGQILAL